MKSTRALIQTLLQTLKAFRLYEADHPLLSKFEDRLKQDFENYFREFDSFAIQVGEHQLLYSGKVIYESADVKESLAFLFFRDGIRELRFFKGIDFKEIVDFLQIVRKGDSVNRLEDDLVTLIWERNFAHIAITTIDDFSEGGTVFIPVTPEDLLKGLEYKGFEEEGAGGKFLIEESIKQDLPSSQGRAMGQAFQLTPDELAKINGEIQVEQQPEHLQGMIEDLTEILLHLEEKQEAFENLVSYFERLLESLLREKDLERVVTVLTKLQEILGTLPQGKRVASLRRILESPSKPHFISMVGEILRSHPDRDVGNALQYFQFLTPEAAGSLCQLLGRLESGKWKKVVTDRLIELSQKDIRPLIPFLSDRNPALVRQILFILEKVNEPSTPKYLGVLLTHPEVRVREATLQLLGQFGERSKDLVIKFLRDPASEIRAKASVMLARIAKEQAVKPLMEIILSDEFYKRDYEEKASFFRALGETGSREAIPALQKIAGKKNLFSKGKWEEMRLCANNALKMIGAQAGVSPNR